MSFAAAWNSAVAEFSVEQQIELLKQTSSTYKMLSSSRVLRMLKPMILVVLALVSAGCSYRQEEVSFRSGDVTLSGTLYTPSGSGLHPAVIFIHGSGPDSREQYRFYADLFARRGMAALIYDKRGVGASTGDWRRSPFSALADDAFAGVQFLKSHPAIDPQRIGAWGGSEGGVIAPWMASRSPDVAFVIMQSATGITFAQQNLHQTERQMRALNLPESEVQEALTFQHLKHAYARCGTGWQAYAKALQDSRSEPWASLGGPTSPDDWWWQWYRTKMDYDPAPMLEQVRVPVLAIWGERDELVPVAESRAAVERAFARGGNRNVTYRVFAEADHSMNTQSGPQPSPEYLETMLEWALEQVNTSK
jgi:dipeptidyl aminopeptidase/acylaminoacyl peptidase